MAKDVSRQIATLEDKLQKLRAQEVDALRKKLKSAQEVVRELEAQIAAKTAKAAGPVGRRKRTPPKETRERISEATKRPLTQKEISDKTALPYGSVVQFLKRNEKEFKITGQRKQKRYLWKGN